MTSLPQGEEGLKESVSFPQKNNMKDILGACWLSFILIFWHGVPTAMAAWACFHLFITGVGKISIDLEQGLLFIGAGYGMMLLWGDMGKRLGGFIKKLDADA